jgi:hypothetical protein
MVIVSGELLLVSEGADKSWVFKLSQHAVRARKPVSVKKLNRK